MSRPFDGDGLTIREGLDKLKKVANHPKTSMLRTLVDKGVTFYLSARHEKNPLLAVNTAVDLVNVGLDILSPPKLLTKRDSSPAHTQFSAIMDSGVHLLDITTAEVLFPLLDGDKCFLVCRDQPDDTSSNSLWKYEYQPDRFFYWMEWADSISSIYILDEHLDDRTEILASFRDLLWEPHGTHIEVAFDESQKTIHFTNKKEIPWDYEGDQGDKLISRWSKFYEAGVRRSVILHGPPGTGKSTLAQQAARELRGRVCYISVQILSRVTIHDLLELLDALAPDIFIVDDLDRMGTRDLEFFLNFFEESENHIPLLLATTNHLDQLPDALKRPGRFDEIWAVNPPEGAVRLKVINYLAKLEGVELSEEAADKLMLVSEDLNLPGAHLRELIRRILVLGEDELDFDPTDLTFDESWRAIENFNKVEYEGYYDSMHELTSDEKGILVEYMSGGWHDDDEDF